MAQAMTEREHAALLGWLGLLGWSVSIERAGARWNGVASRADRGVGKELRIQRSASTRQELISKLFSGALRDLAVAA